MTMILALAGQWPVWMFLVMTLCLGSLCQGVTAESGGSEESRGSGEVRRGMPMNPQGKTRSRLYFERVAGQIEPGLKGKADDLPRYLQHFKRTALNDARQIAFEARAEWDADRRAVVLTGFVEYQEQRDALGEYLGVLGFEVVDDQTLLMPTDSLGDERFGIVTAKSAFLYRGPDAGSERLTQSSRGDPVFLLRPAKDGFFLCHAWDGYVGYIDGREIKRVDADGIAQAIPEPDTRKTDPAIESGMKLIGTPYRWGGTTAQGVDCSGLMRLSFAEVGVLLPRDTDQQATVGRLTATRWHRNDMRRGDLMFFLNSRGRINHTGVYLGDHKMLESGGPGVRILSLDPKDPNYDEKRDSRFCFAKRVIE